MTEPDVDETLEPDEEIRELTGVERGCYRVITQRSSYLFDLTAGTVAREPGPDAKRTVNDRPRPLRSIGVCRVGEVGYWTMKPNRHETERFDYRLHVSTAIRCIERLDEAPIDLEEREHGDEQGC